MKPRTKIFGIFAIIIIALILAKTNTNMHLKSNTALNSDSSLRLSEISSWHYQLQNISYEALETLNHTLIVIDPDEANLSAKQINRLHKQNNIIIAYLSIGEAENYRDYWKKEWFQNPPVWIMQENKEWKGCYAVNVSSKEWQNLTYKRAVKIMRSYDGLYLDKVDVFEDLATDDLSEKILANDMYRFMRSLINLVRNIDPKTIIIPQNGERILLYHPELAKLVDGWAVEDLFYDGTKRTSQEELSERLELLTIIKELDKLVFCIDYVDDGTPSKKNKERIKEFLRLADQYGCIPFIGKTDRKLSN